MVRHSYTTFMRFLIPLLWDMNNPLLKRPFIARNNCSSCVILSVLFDDISALCPTHWLKRKSVVGFQGLTWNIYKIDNFYEDQQHTKDVSTAPDLSCALMRLFSASTYTIPTISGELVMLDYPIGIFSRWSVDLLFLSCGHDDSHGA